ncbi:glycine-rich cell wall structural protein 1.8-like [Papaver somniferum]|uniref:glycine-rich cell wall structural protein 1.8-like n=1 Tax=Papaver somniferum TaxID=3469 RepID=UPI000E7025C5|nr:glycine-rich cell wall structural protein 1.8-like [Papaver somniferum]
MRWSGCGRGVGDGAGEGDGVADEEEDGFNGKERRGCLGSSIGVCCCGVRRAHQVGCTAKWSGCGRGGGDGAGEGDGVAEEENGFDGKERRGYLGSSIGVCCCGVRREQQVGCTTKWSGCGRGGGDGAGEGDGVAEEENGFDGKERRGYLGSSIGVCCCGVRREQQVGCTTKWSGCGRGGGDGAGEGDGVADEEEDGFDGKERRGCLGSSIGVCCCGVSLS